MKKIVSKLLPIDVAFEYIREVLRFGGLQDSDSQEGILIPEEIFALAPEETENIHLIDFAHGGLLPSLPKISDSRTFVQRVPTTVPMAAEIVCKQLASCDKPALWIHEPLLTEGVLKTKNLPYVSIANSIYLVYADGLDVSRLAELIRYSLLSWHFLAFVTDGTRTPASVNDLYRSAKFVLIGAYDGESFLYLRIPPVPSASNDI